MSVQCCGRNGEPCLRIAARCTICTSSGGLCGSLGRVCIGMNRFAAYAVRPRSGDQNRTSLQCFKHSAVLALAHNNVASLSQVCYDNFKFLLTCGCYTL